ncbi:MAG: transcriptional repressor [Synergistales bacterium]|nr:transcriptional repressor [Synergistales bacterium]
MWSLEESVRHLKQQGAKITAQRVAILRRLEKRTDHPSAEEIYQELQEEFPTISFATIYGTAQLLERNNLIKILTIDKKRILLDPNTAPHAHFRCTRCGKVFDVPSSHETMAQLAADCRYDVTQVEIYMYGTCDQCKYWNMH